MLVPVRQLYPTRLVQPNDTQSMTIETNLPVTPILNAKMFFRNTSDTESVAVTLTHVLNLNVDGISDDPLLSGSFSTVVFAETVNPGELLWHVFPAVALMEGYVHHEVSLEISGAGTDVILQMWVEGTFEESLKVLPTYDPIVI